MFPGGNGNYFRIRSLKDARQYMEDERNSRYHRPGRGGGRVAWIVLGVVLLAVLGLALAAAIGG